MNLVAADYQKGLDAYGEGDYDRAFYEWMQVADSPEGEVSPEILAETCYALGMLFWVGQGVQQNTSESALWLRKAAELNHAGAQVKLGFLYSTGEGVPQSDFEAFKWLMMAARQGDPDAQYNLGVIYRDGLGVEPDADKSIHWFQEAAANGDAVSAGILADMGRPRATAYPSPQASPDDELPVRREARAETGPETETMALETTLAPRPVGPQSPWWVDVHGMPLVEEVVETTEPASTTSSISTTAAHPAVNPPVDVVNSAEQSAEPAAQVVPTPTQGASLQTASADEDWLRSRDPDRYTIQVIALLDVEKLHAFMARHPDWAPFAVYEQEWKGKPLWVLVQGDYADVVQAREAVRKFPTDIQKRDKLWTRKFEMVQDLLK